MAKDIQPVHGVPLSALAERFATSLKAGLSAEEAAARLKRYGPNVLKGKSGVSRIRVLVAQIANAMTAVMIIALIISLVIRSWIEAGVIAVVIIVNVVVGYLQQYTAERTMESLRSLTSPTALVLREGRTEPIEANLLVPGDIVELKSGDIVPADIRLLEGKSAEIDEAILTGESQPVFKDVNITYFEPSAVPIADRRNMAFAGTHVTQGRARGIVVGTGMDTEIGVIATSAQGRGSALVAVEDPERWTRFGKQAFFLVQAGVMATGRFLGLNAGTPLQRQLNQLATALFFFAIVLAVVVESVNSFSGSREVIIYAITTGLCMIPASLVVVLTITFALGARRMVKRNVIARRLDSMEALGAVTDICSDKTGTLTQGRMVVSKAWVPSMGTWTIEDFRNPYDPTDGAVHFQATAGYIR